MTVIARDVTPYDDRLPSPTGWIIVDGVRMAYWLPAGKTAAEVRVGKGKSS